MSRRRPSSRRSATRSTRRRSPSPSRYTWLAALFIILAIIGVVWYFNTRPAVAPSQIGGLPSEITIARAYDLYQQETAVFVDVRERSEWDNFHIPGAILIPLGELASRVDELPRDRQIVVVCDTGNRSRLGRTTLLAAGFPDVTSMNGGVSGWRTLGYPTVNGP
ncbi:MAG: rhodanese-like domain-containing protein [Anaerolineales bacterium]|nr:rhodanese-like domain-containing protein [Anaerolineales bacterium]